MTLFLYIEPEFRLLSRLPIHGSGRYTGFGHPAPKYSLMRPILLVYNTFKIYIRMPSFKENTFISEVAAPNDITIDKLYAI